jgi:putative addiction module killer protein
LLIGNFYGTIHTMKVKEYTKKDGSNPYKKWFNSLNTQAAAKVAVAKYRLQQGNTSSVKWFSGIGEYRINWGPGYRVYLVKDGENLIILFGGGTKKKQKADIDEAIKLHKEYKQRKSLKK